MFALNKWLLSWCKDQKLLFVNNLNLFWEKNLFLVYFVLMACTPAESGGTPVRQHLQDATLYLTSKPILK